jgi:hypothetical protein
MRVRYCSPRYCSPRALAHRALLLTARRTQDEAPPHARRCVRKGVRYCALLRTDLRTQADPVGVSRVLPLLASARGCAIAHRSADAGGGSPVSAQLAPVSRVSPLRPQGVRSCSPVGARKTSRHPHAALRPGRGCAVAHRLAEASDQSVARRRQYGQAHGYAEAPQAAGARQGSRGSGHGKRPKNGVYPINTGKTGGRSAQPAGKRAPPDVWLPRFG